MSNQANASKELQAANAESIDFDTVTAHGLLTRMAQAISDSDTAKQDKENASLEFCQFATTVMSANKSVERGTVTAGFTKHLDAMRPMLAAEGNAFVEVKQDGDKDPTYSWKGHGNNVKSIAKGVTEFYGLSHESEDGTEYPAIVNPRDAESFTEVKKSVEQARRYGEKEEARLLREAKEALRESCKAFIAEVITSDDYELIADQSLEVDNLLIDWLADAEAQAELDAEATKPEQVVIPEQIADDDEDEDDEDDGPQAATA